MTSQVEYGWPLERRKERFRELDSSPNSSPGTQEIDFSGSRHYLPIWSVPLGLPKFRLANGRTVSLQKEWVSRNPDKGEDFFSRDIESLEVQAAQFELLIQLIKEKDLLSYFEDARNKQSGAIILDSNGFVVNGNRRLCTWRYLYARDASLYGHFSEISVIVLPPSDDKAIDKLEGALQVEKDRRADYEWHSLANMIIDRKGFHDLDNKAIADFYQIGESEVNKLIDMRNYGVTYLHDRGWSGQWSRLTDKKYAFEKLVEKRKQIVSPGEKKLFEAAAFALIDDPSGGRLYESIPDLYKYLEKIKKRLSEEFSVDSSASAAEEDDLLGVDVDDEFSYVLAKKIGENQEARAKVADIVKDVISDEKSLDKDRGSAEYVRKRLQKANGEVQSAIMNYRPDVTSMLGVYESIESIEVGLAQLKDLIKKYAKN